MGSDTLKVCTLLYLNKNVTVRKNSKGILGKTCTLCKKFKKYDNFGIHWVDGKHYLVPRCYKCKNLQLKQFRKVNKEKTLYWSCKHRAKRWKTVFDLTESDIKIPEFCPILGIPLNKNGGLKRSDFTPTVDRVDNAKGYTKDNIVICSWRANKIKSDASLEEIEKIYKFMKKKLKSQKEK